MLNIAHTFHSADDRNHNTARPSLNISVWFNREIGAMIARRLNNALDFSEVEVKLLEFEHAINSLPWEPEGFPVEPCEFLSPPGQSRRKTSGDIGRVFWFLLVNSRTKTDEGL